MTIFGDRTFMEILNVIRVGPQSNRTGILIRRKKNTRAPSDELASPPAPPTHPIYTEKGHVRHGEKTTIYKPGGEASPNHTLILDV